MSNQRTIHFSSFSARVQYILLMGLFRLAVTRGLFGAFARGLGRVFNAQNAAYLREAGSAPFKIYLNDGYWTRFALFKQVYEPEVATILTAASGKTTVFCDLGANKGYWSVRAAARFDRVIAVEASGETFANLTENTRSLANVACLRKAIHATSGQALEFVNIPHSHASARLRQKTDKQDMARMETVRTISIDDLLPPGIAALIKLDVEGAEIDAFSGASRAFGDGAVFIYEDHGADHDCLPSAHLLNDPDIRVYSCENGVQRLTTVAEIRALKTDPFKGYNFIAARKDAPLLQSILEDFANHPA